MQCASRFAGRSAGIAKEHRPVVVSARALWNPPGAFSSRYHIPFVVWACTLPLPRKTSILPLTYADHHRIESVTPSEPFHRIDVGYLSAPRHVHRIVHRHFTPSSCG